jgi:hypothetical protein
MDLLVTRDFTYDLHGLAEDCRSRRAVLASRCRALRWIALHWLVLGLSFSVLVPHDQRQTARNVPIRRVLILLSLSEDIGVFARNHCVPFYQRV